MKRVVEETPELVTTDENDSSYEQLEITDVDEMDSLDFGGFELTDENVETCTKIQKKMKEMQLQIEILLNPSEEESSPKEIEKIEIVENIAEAEFSGFLELESENGRNGKISLISSTPESHLKEFLLEHLWRSGSALRENRQTEAIIKWSLNAQGSNNLPQPIYRENLEEIKRRLSLNVTQNENELSENDFIGFHVENEVNEEQTSSINDMERPHTRFRGVCQDLPNVQPVIMERKRTNK
ncbi:UNVERIFIED_CONTAM: hypothetical protein RMT77_007013 [Armadillidium vulgare]